MLLRGYQKEILKAIHTGLERHRSILVQLPSGAGKTVIACEHIRRSLGAGSGNRQRSKQVWVLVHRTELVNQFYRTLLEMGVPPEEIGVMQSGWDEITDEMIMDRDWESDHLKEQRDLFRKKMNSLGVPREKISVVEAGINDIVAGERPIWICGINTLVRRYGESFGVTMRRRGPRHDYSPPGILKNMPDTLIVDEAHHSPATKTFLPVIKRVMKSARSRLIGLSATPARTDGVGLGDIYDHIICGISMGELIKRGHLAPYRAFTLPSDLALDRLKQRAGDYVRGGLENLVKPVSAKVVDQWMRYGEKRQTLVFAVGKAHAKVLFDEFKKRGVRTGYVDGEIPKAEREEEIEKFRRRLITCLVSIDVLGEGFDAPECSVVVLARPTMSLIVHFQQIGRALRPKSDKSDALILDMVGNIHRHGLPDTPREWTLEGTSIGEADVTDVMAVHVQCNRCFAWYERSASRCPHCRDAAPKRQREPIEEVDVSLVEMTGGRALPSTRQIENILRLGEILLASRIKRAQRLQRKIFEEPQEIRTDSRPISLEEELRFEEDFRKERGKHGAAGFRKAVFDHQEKHLGADLDLMRIVFHHADAMRELAKRFNDAVDAFDRKDNHEDNSIARLFGVLNFDVKDIHPFKNYRQLLDWALAVEGISIYDEYGNIFLRGAIKKFKEETGSLKGLPRPKIIEELHEAEWKIHKEISKALDDLHPEDCFENGDDDIPASVLKIKPTSEIRELTQKSTYLHYPADENADALVSNAYFLLPHTESLDSAPGSLPEKGARKIPDYLRTALQRAVGLKFLGNALPESQVRLSTWMEERLGAVSSSGLPAGLAAFGSDGEDPLPDIPLSANPEAAYMEILEAPEIRYATPVPIEDNDGALYLYDENGNYRAEISFYDDNETEIFIIDRQGYPHKFVVDSGESQLVEKGGKGSSKTGEQIEKRLGVNPFEVINQFRKKYLHRDD